MALKNLFRRGPKPIKTMDTEQTQHAQQYNAAEGTAQQENVPTDNLDTSAEPADSPSEQTVEAELELLRTEHRELHDKHIRLFAEFDNFRKRTAKERLDLIQYANQNTLNAILPVVDDMDRAVANNEKVDDVVPVREGMKLILQKFMNVLAAQGLKPMSNEPGVDFDTDLHEAITKAPAPSEKMKGKVLDVVEKGYTLNDKVIRYAKVVVGE